MFTLDIGGEILEEIKLVTSRSRSILFNSLQFSHTILKSNEEYLGVLI